LDTTTKALIVGCLILVGTLSFVSGMLFSETWKTTQKPIIHTNNTTNTPNNNTKTDNTPPATEEPDETSETGPGHHIYGPVYYTYDDEITHDWVAWYYDADVGQYFSEYEHWDPEEGCYHD